MTYSASANGYLIDRARADREVSDCGFCPFDPLWVDWAERQIWPIRATTVLGCWLGATATNNRGWDPPPVKGGDND